MAPNRFMTDLDFTKTQMAVYFVVLLLSVQELNPVHILVNAIGPLKYWHLATLATSLMIYVTLSEIKQVVIWCVKIFFHSILSIFFSQVEVVGLENIPQRGPVLFTINHANQFIDAVMVFCTCQRTISYIMAEASYNRRIIGDIAFLMQVVPVKRAQDEARPGTGKITMAYATASTESKGDEASATNKHIELKGHDGTIFTRELARGDKIRPPGTAHAFKVLSVQDDSTATLEGADVPSQIELPSNSPVAFDLLKKVDTHVVFEKVVDRLASGGAVGIFPEGGSHDRTDLLPLKVGISLIAYTALEKDNLNIPIVPVGLNYFRAHRWRGKAVIEYGRPTMIDPTTLSKYQEGGAARRQVCNNLLEDIERSMKSVIVSAPDYETLQLIHTARRLWQRRKGPLDAKEKQDLTRRFAQGYQMLLQQPNPPPEWIQMQERVVEYKNQLKDLGIRDYQVPALHEQHMEQELTVQTVKENPNQALNLVHLTYQILHLLFLILVAAIPFLLINFPVGVLAGWYAERRRKKALAKSKVKIKGYDVMLTEKVVFCIVAIPTLWIVYFLALQTLTDLNRRTTILCIASLPVFSYMGIVAAEAGMVDVKDLRPLLMRLHPGARKELATLPAKRKKLQDDLRAFIKEIGPKYLGDIYEKPNIDWAALWEKEKARSSSTPETPSLVSMTPPGSERDDDDKEQEKSELQSEREALEDAAADETIHHQDVQKAKGD